MNTVREIIALIIAGFIVFVFCIFALAALLPVISIAVFLGIIKVIAGTLKKLIKREKISKHWITEIIEKEKNKYAER